MTKISAFRAKASFSVLTSEKQIVLDFANLPNKPIETSRGDLTVEQAGAGGNVMLRFLPVAGANGAVINRPLPMMMMLMTKDGRTVSTTTTTGAQLGISGAAITAAGDGAKATLSWVESARDCVLPIELKDIEVPGGR